MARLKECPTLDEGASLLVKGFRKAFEKGGVGKKSGWETGKMALMENLKPRHRGEIDWGDVTFNYDASLCYQAGNLLKKGFFEDAIVAGLLLAVVSQLVEAEDPADDWRPKFIKEFIECLEEDPYWGAEFLHSKQISVLMWMAATGARKNNGVASGTSIAFKKLATEYRVQQHPVALQILQSLSGSFELRPGATPSGYLGKYVHLRLRSEDEKQKKQDCDHYPHMVSIDDKDVYSDDLEHSAAADDFQRAREVDTPSIGIERFAEIRVELEQSRKSTKKLDLKVLEVMEKRFHNQQDSPCRKVAKDIEPDYGKEMNHKTVSTSIKRILSIYAKIKRAKAEKAFAKSWALGNIFNDQAIMPMHNLN